MKLGFLAVLTLAFVLPAAARAQGEAKPAAAFDPVGKYVISTVVQGQSADFDVVIEKKDDGTYTGTFTNPAFGTSVISSLKVDGRTMKITIATPQGVEAGMELTVKDDNTIEGNWGMQGDGGKVTGKKSG